MGKRRSGWANGALNLALVVLGLGVLVLLYAFVTRSFFPEDPGPIARAENPVGAPAGEIVQISVRNGCGVAGLAAEATRYLREQGFDVVEAGNYTSFDQEQSFVVDRVGNLEAARRVAAAMGIPEARVRQDIRPEYYLDASVIIGSDYPSLKPFQDAK